MTAPSRRTEREQCPHGTRRRGDTLEHAIFAAVFDQLATVGYGELTMEGVAAAARTGKAALYRRWSNREELVIDAIDHMLPTLDHPPDTGSVRADITELLRRMSRSINGPTGCALQTLMGRVDRDRDFMRVVHQRVIGPRRQMMLDALRRGIERGEVRPGAATQLVAEVGPALVVYRYLTQGPVGPRLIEAILDEVLMPLLRP